MKHKQPEGMTTYCLIIRPLPEEEELEDDLFAGTSEEIDPGNENRMVNSALLYNIKGNVKTHMPTYMLRELLVTVIIPAHCCS